jgi:tRNA modification GTPase
MQQAARLAIDTADVLLLLIDPSDAEHAAIERSADLRVFTKADIHPNAPTPAGGLRVSAHLGTGMRELRERLDEQCFGPARDAGHQVALTARHVGAIEAALSAVQRAHGAMESGAEIVALELREALDLLGEVRGVVSSDEVLGRVFARFCIGK